MRIRQTFPENDRRSRLAAVKLTAHHILELGNGKKHLSRGYVPDVPIATVGLTVKIGLIVTNQLHEVDLVLGINWLQPVNPVVDWGGARLYVPNTVQTVLLQGDWLAGHVHSGTITVLSGEEELKCMKGSRMQVKYQF